MRAFSIGTVAIVSALLLAGWGKEEKQEQSEAEQSSTAAPATTNEAATAWPQAMLYHINFGFPALNSGTVVSFMDEHVFGPAL